MGFEIGNKVGKQFTSENQPANRGRKEGKGITYYLREYGNSKKVEFEIKNYKDGKKTPEVKKGTIESETTLNELVAVTLYNKAIQGDNKAIATILERTEGKVAQNVNVAGQDTSPEPIVFKIIKNNEQ